MLQKCILVKPPGISSKSPPKIFKSWLHVHFAPILIQTYIHTYKLTQRVIIALTAHDIREKLLVDSKIIGLSPLPFPPPPSKNKAMGMKSDRRLYQDPWKKKRPKLTADVVLRQQGYYVHHLDSPDIQSRENKDPTSRSRKWCGKKKKIGGKRRFMWNPVNC